jgi:hypothetical protein
MRDIQEQFAIELVTRNGSKILENTNVEKIYFIEDIYSICIVGKLIFREREGLFEFGPITGDETLVLYYGSENREYRFSIYKIAKGTPLTSLDGKMNVFEIDFVDASYPAFFRDIRSFSYSAKKYTDIVKDLAKRYAGIESYEIFENSNESIENFNTSSKTIGNCIKWLISRASGQISKQPGFLFYQTSQEKPWNLVTLEYLLSQKNLLETEGETKYGFFNENLFHPNKILSYNMSHIDRQSLGSLSGGIRRGYDSKRKKFIKREYVYTDALKRFTILGKKSLFIKNIDNPNVRVENIGEAEENIIDNIYFGQWIKQYCNQLVVTFTVKGHEGRYAGALIDVEWPSTSDREIYNKNLMGKYLIKSVIHQFSGENPIYSQKLVCIKNGYYDSDDDSLAPAIKKNIG